MGIYEELGVRPIINAAGTLTRLGGSRMAPEVLAAMREAATNFVRIEELQAKAGAVIAELTGAEAGYVVAGAAAGLTLAAAACLVRDNVAMMDRLPDTSDLPNEIVVQRGHRNAYDHALRAAGAKLVEAGYLGYPGAGGTFAWQIVAEISERTIALFCPVLDTPGTLPLPEVAALAHAHNLPVIVDAAAALPPRANLRRFIDEGADLVVFSGGKAIAGPQASGILAGRADLIRSVALQHQDMDVRAPTWYWRELLANGTLAGIPHQGMGRGLKVGREEIVGLIVALRRYVAGSDEADLAQWDQQVAQIAEQLHGLPGVRCERQYGKQPVPRLAVTIDPDVTGQSAYEVSRKLLDAEPAIAVSENRAEFGTLQVVPQGLTGAETELVAARLRAVLGG